MTWFTLLIAAIWAMAYYRTSLSTFTTTLFVILLLGTFFDAISLFAWLLFAIIAIPLNVDNIRKEYITAPLLAMFKKIMPEMSSTEQEALDAGTTWFDAELFRGDPDWKKFHQTPQPRLSVEEQAFINGPVEQVCAMINDWQITHVEAEIPNDVWQFLKEHKFFAMIIKKEYGGLEFSAYAQSKVLQKLAGVSTVVASTVGVPNSLGPGELLQHYGTEEQKSYYLPRLADGEEIPCFALTSPEAGSDAGSIPDIGIICKGTFDGEEIIGMKLSWNKRYITLAPIATVLGLAFKLHDPENLIGDNKDLGITCALIPTNIEGVITGKRHFPLNVPFSNGPTQGEEVFVPLDFIIGGVEMAGQGWRMLVECLSVGRAITLPSNSAGGVKSLAMVTGAYARIRRQFKLPIGKMEGIEEVMAPIGANAYLMDAVTTMTTGAIDLGEKPAVISAICKYHLTERMRTCVTHAMDIHGGKGICMGPNNYLARGFQGAPIAITVEGANILTRNMIIYGQGAIRCHPYVLAEINAANNTDEISALNDFDHALFGHIGFATSNIMRSLWFSLSGAYLLSAPYKDKTRRYYQLITKFSSNLAMLSDIAMLTLGGELKKRERLSARLGDILSNLYLACATLKRFNDEGRANKDIALVQWAVEDSLYQCQTAIDSFINNFPNKFIRYGLKLILQPFGRRLKRPNDKCEHKVTKIMMTPGDSRDRLGQGQYFAPSENYPIGKIEQALKDVLAAEPIFERVCNKLGKTSPFIALDKYAQNWQELGHISDEEAELLNKAEMSRLYTINVDDFNSDQLKALQ